MTRRRFFNALLARVVALVLLGLSGCTVYRTRYFERVGTEEMRFDRYRLSPRIFAYKEEKAASPRVAKGAFTVTVRVEDAMSALGNYKWQTVQPLVDSLADQFLAGMTNLFVVDSLVLHEIPADRVTFDTVGLRVNLQVDEAGPRFKRIRLEPDRRNYSPRRENYLTIKFGETNLDLSTVALRAVLHITRSGSVPSADSAVFLMSRIETEGTGLMMFRDNAYGY